MNFIKRVLTAILTAGTVLGVSAQDNNTPTFGLQKSFGLDSINLVTLTPELTLPLYSKPGPLRFTPHVLLQTPCNLSPFYDGSHYRTEVLCLLSDFVGVSPADDLSGLTYSTISLGGNCYELNNFSLVEQDGSSHPFYGAAVYNASNCGPTSGTFISSDDTGFQIHVSDGSSGLTSSIYDASGNLYSTGVAPSITDPYGNTISYNGSAGTWTDEYGIASPISTGSGLRWLDSSGNNQTLQIMANNTNVISTNFGACVQVQESGSGRGFVTSYSYPDGSAIGISWEQGATSGTFTGRLGGYTTRQGDQVTYTYSGEVCHGTVVNNTAISGSLYPTTLTRTDADGTWTFSTAWGYVNNVDTETTTVLDPGQNKTVYTFTGFAIGAPYATSPSLTEVQVYQNTGTVSLPSYILLKTIVHCYNGNTSSCPTTYSKFPITERYTYTTLGGMTQSSHVMEKYDSYGNVTSKVIYGPAFGSATPYRTTTITYGSWNGTTCVALGNNINDTPCDVKTVDSASNILSETHNTYTAKGFLSTISNWTGTRWLTSSRSVNASNGTVNTTTAANGLVTTYGYANGCNGLLPTSTSTTVATGDVLTSSKTWDCNMALVMGTVDANSNTTSTTYDSLGRPTSYTDQMGAETNATYASNSVTVTPEYDSESHISTVDGLGRGIRSQAADFNSQYDTSSNTYGWVGPNFVVGSSLPCFAALNADCASVVNVTSDPLGRPIKSVRTSNETITTTYNQNDTTTTLSPAPTNEHVRTSQLEVDALGRPTSTCAIEVSGGVSCGQVAGGSGVLDAYAYSSTSVSGTVSVTRGSQTHTTVKDALGRVISDTRPESGITQYTYDVPTTACTNPAWNSAMPGTLVQTQDANGNITCLYRDLLGRLAAVFVASGGQYCKAYSFDQPLGSYSQQPPSGATLSNIAGRLVEADTNDCAWPRTASDIYTEEWFSYDKDGRVTDMWEKTPHSGGFYHSGGGYFANGLIQNWILNTPPLYSATWGEDPYGRITLLELGTQPVVGFHNSQGMYDAAGHIVSVPLGSNTSTDQDVYTYDPNTGKMKTFEFDVNGKSLTGSLTWNASQTLAKMAVVDGFNAGGTETCVSDNTGAVGAGYDDLSRLVEFDCGSGKWGQQFGYDQYNNLTKTQLAGRIGTTWNPGYTSNNQCSGCTYDANGNMTADGNNNYGWDSFNKLKWTATSGTPTCGSSGRCFVYDALGRMVERSNGSTWYEVWYTPAGEITMSGTTPVFGIFTGPGGTAVVNGIGGGAWRHTDWLGNARLVSDVSNHTVTLDQSYTPYAEINTSFGNNSGQYQSFAGLNGLFAFDTLWDTPNRELSFTGRWLSPDPARASWNAYAYPTNPNSNTDPTGLAQGKGPDPGCAAVMNADCPWQSIFSSVDAVDLMNIPVLGGSEFGPLWRLNSAAGGPDPTVASIDDQANISYEPDTLASYQPWYETIQGRYNPFVGVSLAANNGWMQGPDPVAVARSVRAYVVATLKESRPTICGGGAFGFYGKGVTAFGVKGFTGVIGEWDSRSGVSGGVLSEAGAFGVGAGSIVGSSGVSRLGFVELGEIPGVGSAGALGFAGAGGSGLGGYAEGEFVGREAGGGGYLNITPVSACH